MMKTVLTLFMCAFSILHLEATCAWNGLSAFPSGNTIRQNAVIVIDGYAASQEVVRELNKKYPVYLKSEKHNIRLVVKEILVGQYSLTQAVLLPERELTVGLEYTLVIDSLPEDDFLNRWNEELKKNEPVVYSVVAGIDSIKPIFSSRPKELKKSLVRMGCGPSIHVVFDCTILDSSACLVKATVRNEKSGKEASYYLKPNKGTISIGHGMCSGAFSFDECKNYEVEFSLMDVSGNVTSWTGNRIKFTKPTKPDKGYDNR
jgi:hypothetical protein